MEGRGGCCIARYAGGGGGGNGLYGMSKVERIMLKFRPIAPKPVAAGSASGGSAAENSEGYVKSGRAKRRYVRVNGGNKSRKGISTGSRGGRKRKVSDVASAPGKSVAGGGEAVVTLSLLPETPDRKEASPSWSSPTPSNNSDLACAPVAKARKCNGNNNNNNKKKKSPIWLSFNNQQEAVCDGHVFPVSDGALLPKRAQVVSFVTVECVTDTWMNGEGFWFGYGFGFGFSEEERVVKMRRDTCPGFISDGGDRVVWTNEAYREMVGSGGGGGGEMVVWLVRKDNRVTVPVGCPAFTCKVRVTCETLRTSSSSSSSTLTMPCDVWRLTSGGYAWRLDVKAALCLGR